MGHVGVSFVTGAADRVMPTTRSVGEITEFDSVKYGTIYRDMVELLHGAGKIPWAGGNIPKGGCFVHSGLLWLIPESSMK